MISRTESSLEMILLLKGLAKATAAAAKKHATTKNRAVSIFMIQQISTFFVSATEIRSGMMPLGISGRGRHRRTMRISSHDNCFASDSCRSANGSDQSLGLLCL
jgi:hypothetical protein